MLLQMKGKKGQQKGQEEEQEDCLQPMVTEEG